MHCVVEHDSQTNKTGLPDRVKHRCIDIFGRKVVKGVLGYFLQVTSHLLHSESLGTTVSVKGKGATHWLL